MAVTFLLFQVVVALLAVVLYYVHRNLSYFKRRNIPHESPHWLKGNLRELRSTRNFHDIYEAYYNKFKKLRVPFVGLFIHQRPAVFVMDLELVKHILIKDFSNFSDKGIYYNEKDDPISAHLFNLDGPQWRVLRNKMSSTFTSGKMKFMFPTVVAVANEFMAVMNEKSQENSVLEIRDLMARFTIDVIGTCAFGLKCNSLREEDAEFLQMGRATFQEKNHCNLVLAFMESYPYLGRKLGLVRTTKRVQDFYSRIVKETVAIREKENIKRSDFMDLLIELKNKKNSDQDHAEESKGITIEEVIAQAFIFFVAGFETSSSTMGYALYELAKNPHIQDKVRAEVEQVFEKHNQQFTYECMKDLKYLKQVISETLRLYTIVPHLNRQALKRYVVPGNPNYVIEAGQAVIIPAAAIHRDPEIYPDPEEFQPERFSPEECAKRDSVTWLSFGDGPRNCIGLRFGEMQSRIGLALLIKNFKFSTCAETPKTLEYDPNSFVLGVKGGIQLKVEAISRS
ncbi:uncharacterized protein Dwil_GK21806 [Drosophila willistoni]|uniref:GK21806 n=1 Tax=Drosophila willistoni TaxID=7260 RepID=B4MQ06_DROWI|nr:uncharacterized protein Dwil_GK21806 [Drosophila willistoni]